MGGDSSVGIATHYGTDSLGIESQWGARFSSPVHTGPGAHPASCTMGTGSIQGVKRAGRGVNHTPSSSAEVKEGVELYLYSPSGPSWPVLGWNLPLTLPYLFSKHVWKSLISLRIETCMDVVLFQLHTPLARVHAVPNPSRGKRTH